LATAAIELLPRTSLYAAMKTRGHEPSGEHPFDVAEIVNVFRSVEESFPVPLTCLPRALALTLALRASGWKASVRIGVRKQSEAASVDGHAWVELDGVVVYDVPEMVSRYHSLHYR